MTEQELAWITTAGADIRAVFDAPTTTLRERKQLIRAVITEIGITVHAERRVAELRIVWQGGAVTEVSMPMNKPGGHLRVTDEDTIALVRRLAQHYDDRTIAAILAKQKRRTATGLPFTRARVAILRANHAIPVYQPPRSPMSDPTATMSSWSPSPKQKRSSGSAGSRSTGGSAMASSPPNRSPRQRRGASASTRPCATGSSPRYPRAGSDSTRPPRPSASPDKPCCTRSNAANCKPSTSTADAAKACVSRSNPTKPGLFDTH